MKEDRKTYERNFKEKAVQLSYERDNISQLAKELGITAPYECTNGVRITKNLEQEVFLEKEN